MISPIHPNKFPMTEKIIDRDQLQEAYIESIIDGMDHKSLWQYVYDNLNDHLDKYTVDELITEVEDYYPELLNDNDEDKVPDESTGWN
jgi:regulator of protease activity HflC (stomatin/prohibitin superfamily)